MGITLVIRGDDHINNTPRQINIYEALGATPPEFAHVPMILGEDGARLSKRHGAVSVLQYRDMGYLPEALLNYLVRLGWSHGDQEVFTRAEMIELFSIDDVNRKAAAFDHDKLNWLNQHWMKSLPPEEVARHLAPQFDAMELDPAQGPALPDLVRVQAERVETLAEMAARSRPFYEEFADYDPGAAKKHLRPVAEGPMRAIRETLASLEDWVPDSLDRAVRDTAESLELGMGKIAQPLRVALTGTGMSPSIDLTLWLVGKDRTLARIDRALEFIAARAAARG
jgi:glutamyl-tRNA synthetase